MTALRYVDLTPLGVMRGLSGTRRDDASILLQALLRRDPGRAWDPGEFAALPARPLKVWARLMFELQGAGCIDTSLTRPGNPDRHWAGIQSDLAAMVALGASQATLLDGDGLVLAQAGGAPDLAAPPADVRVPLKIGDGASAAAYALVLRGLAHERCPPLVRLARRLARQDVPLVAAAPAAPLEAARPLEDLLAWELRRLADQCPGLLSTAIASRDGLALAATGIVQPDALSATSAFLLDEMDTHLRPLREGAGAREVLVWTDSGPWYFSAIGALPYLLALHAAPHVPAALLRHAGAQGCARMTALLAPLNAA
ncbi:roadblock/LC7 domain-containing protein [Roseateles sp.]|uniref:roadblock/LC7 domain-containing protein n=1 Tax=Roseateles sp. TaxID=1971397 RepID=UPI0031DFC11B